MPERHDRYDPDERFSLYTQEGEEVLTHLLHGDEDDNPDGDALGGRGLVAVHA